MQTSNVAIRRMPVSLRPLPARPAVCVRAREDKQAANEAGDAQYSAPPQYPMYQAKPGQAYAPPPAAPASTTPFWVWLIVGAAGMWVINKIQDFRRNPLGAMAGMMGGKTAAGGAGQQDMAQMMQMMMDQQKKQQQAAASNFGGSTINTTAAEVTTPTPSNRDGSKFQQNKQAPSAAATVEAPTAPDTASTSFFTDKKTEAAPSSFFTDAQAPPQTESDSSEAMVENMLMMVADNPELQKQLGQHLPENMRNESTWKWIKENPDIRKQLAKQVAPAMKSQFGDMSSFQDYASGPMGNDQAMDQMKAMGVDPNEMMSKLMADPEMVQLITKPGVAEALMDMQANPNNSFKYMSNPDIAKLMNKMVALNPMLSGAGAASADKTEFSSAT